MSTKRVILADGARLLREMLHRVIDEAEHLEVVRELADDRDVAQAIESFDPEWVIISASFSDRSHGWIHEYPSVRFMFVPPNENYVKMKWKLAYEENYSDLSLKDLIHLLEKDLQHT